jgi:hypothetical protein
MSGFGVLIDHQQLRSAADKMQGFASDAVGIPPSVNRDSRSADSANRGFMTNEACEAIAKDLDDDMEKLKRHLEDTARGLREMPDAWEEIDRANAAIFEVLLEELNGYKPSGR